MHVLLVVELNHMLTASTCLQQTLILCFILEASAQVLKAKYSVGFFCLFLFYFVLHCFMCVGEGGGGWGVFEEVGEEF